MSFKYLNRCSVKLSTPELIKEAIESYCNHLAQGYPKESWFFKKDGKPMCAFQTVEKYIEEMDSDFTSIQLAAAESERYKKWFDTVSGSANGIEAYKNANTASLQMIMRNMFGWDKREDTSSSQNDSAPLGHLDGKSKELAPKKDE